MRIGCLGNMNNIVAPTAQYLAEMGHEVDLFLLFEYDHFAPEAEYDDPSMIKFNIKKLNMDFGAVMDIPQEVLERELSGYDMYIGTDYAPALLARINRRLDIFAWAGTDLFDWPFYTPTHNPPHMWEIEKILTAAYQFQGVKYTHGMAMAVVNDFIQECLDRIGFTGKSIDPIPYMNYKNFKFRAETETPCLPEILKLKEQGYTLFVQHGRQHWKTATPETTKGNEVFLEGMGKYLKKNPDTKLKILLFEYGHDVEASKELIAEWGFTDNIFWVPKMQRKQLLNILSVCDLGIGYFTTDTWLTYCTIVEFMASELPVIGRRDDEHYIDKGLELFPMLSARDPDGVEQKLEEFFSNRSTWKANGLKAKEWLLDYNLGRFEKYIKGFISTQRERKLPLKARLSLWRTHRYCDWLRVYNSLSIKMNAITKTQTGNS